MSFELRDYIITIKNVVPEQLCDAILTEYAGSPEWQPTYVKSGLDSNIRSAKTILMSTDQCIAIKPHVRRMLDNEMYKSASSAIQQYNARFRHANIEKDTGYELLRYNVGEFYIEHTDSYVDNPRAVSCIFALNDGYTGGEFAFFGGQLKLVVPKGSALMFPSNFMYPHAVLPIKSGVRYSIVTWFV